MDRVKLEASRRDVIGKKVKVTGAIAETDGTQIIRVTSVSPME